MGKRVSNSKGQPSKNRSHMSAHNRRIEIQQAMLRQKQDGKNFAEEIFDQIKTSLGLFKRRIQNARPKRQLRRTQTR